MTSKWIVALLELGGGFFFQTFGLGNIFAGDIIAGITIMLFYWLLCAINFLLCFVLVGFITWPITWLLFAYFSTNRAIKKII